MGTGLVPLRYGKHGTDHRADPRSQPCYSECSQGGDASARICPSGLGLLRMWLRSGRHKSDERAGAVGNESDEYAE
jgi:hypothetical protein